MARNGIRRRHGFADDRLAGNRARRREGRRLRLHHRHGVSLDPFRPILAIPPAIPPSAVLEAARTIFSWPLIPGPLIPRAIVAGAIVTGTLVTRAIISWTFIARPVVPGTIVPRAIIAVTILRPVISRPIVAGFAGAIVPWAVFPRTVSTFIAVAVFVAVGPAVANLAITLSGGGRFVLGSLRVGGGGGLCAAFVFEVDVKAGGELVAAQNLAGGPGRLHGADDSEIVFGVLQEVLRQHPVAAGAGVPGQLLIFLEHVLGVSPHLDPFRTRRVERPIGVLLLGLAPHRSAAAVTTALTFHSFEISHTSLTAPPPLSLCSVRARPVLLLKLGPFSPNKSVEDVMFPVIRPDLFRRTPRQAARLSVWCSLVLREEAETGETDKLGGDSPDLPIQAAVSKGFFTPVTTRSRLARSRMV